MEVLQLHKDRVVEATNLDQTEQWVLMPMQLTCQDCNSNHSCDKCYGDCQWLQYTHDEKTKDITCYTQCPLCYHKELVKMLETEGCPTCKKKHICKCGTKCRWVHDDCFDDNRDQRYTKAQCISCYNKEFRAQQRKESQRRWMREDEYDNGRDYTACGGDCGYCGQCDY